MPPKKIKSWFKKLSLKNKKVEEVAVNHEEVLPAINSERIINIEHQISERSIILKEDSSSVSDFPEHTDHSCAKDPCVPQGFVCVPIPQEVIQQENAKRVKQVKLKKELRTSAKKWPVQADSQSFDFNSFVTDAEPLVVAPILDKEGKVNKELDLGEALALLMKRGIMVQDEALSESDDDNEVQTIKSSQIASKSSSEASNASLVLRSRLNLRRSVRKSKKTTRKLLKSKSLPSVDRYVDECVNTSVQNMAPVTIDDSLVQLKMKRFIDDNSCTQYFALRSRMNLETYVQQARAQENKRYTLLSHLVSDALLNRRDDDAGSEIVIKQKGKITLSKASDFSETSPQNTAAEISIHETQLAITNLDADHHSSHENIRDKRHSMYQLVSQDETTYFKKAERKEASQIKICRTCHQKRIPLTSMVLDDTSPRKTSKSGDIPHEYHKDTKDTMFEDSSSDDLLEGTAQMQMVLVKLELSSELINLRRSAYNIPEVTQDYMLAWNFLKNPGAYHFSINQINDEQVIMNERIEYDFDITPGIYLFLSKCPLAIELFNIAQGREILIGKCNVKLGKCLDDITNIYQCGVQLHNKDLCLCYDNLNFMQFGKLVIRCRIRGDQDEFDKCKPPTPQAIAIPPMLETHEMKVLSGIHMSPSQQNNSYHGRGNIVSEAELQAFQDGLNLVLVRNKALRTTQEEITQELKERTTWMHEELKWRLTLQENAILCGKDPESIKWRQWKDETTATVRYRPLSHEEFLKEGVAHIEIEILELILLADSKPILNENLKHLYIELTFLNMTGNDMETLTMHKPTDEKQPVKFRFRKVFDFHVESKEAAAIADMIKNNESIPFTLIAQPSENRNELQSCYDFGVANLVLFDLLQSRHNTSVESIPVQDAYNKDVIVGYLKIKFVGVLAMRSMALHILTPPTFKIIR